MKLWRLTLSSELIGLIAGVLIFTTRPFQGLMINTPAWLLLAIVLLGSLASFAVALGCTLQSAEPNSAVRKGIAGAGIAAVVAASVFALMARSTPGVTSTIHALLGGGLSILPAMFGGLFSAIAVVMLLAGRPLSGDSSPPKSEFSEVMLVWLLRVVVGMIVVAAFIVPITPIAPVPTASNNKPTAPKQVPFIYKVPPEMSSAHALQWRLADRRTISGTISDVLALSHDDRWLAYVPLREQVLQVIDLHSSLNSRRATLKEPISRMCFSPDSDRVFVVSKNDPTVIAVVDLKTDQFIRLPKPKKRAMPDGEILWWRDKEILIVPKGSERFMLNLNTLEIDNAKFVASWRDTDSVLREKTLRELSNGSRDSSRWAWQFSPWFDSAELPEVEGVPYWPIKSSNHLAIMHPEHNSRLVFRSISVESGDRFLMSKDGSKVLRSRGNQIDVMYFDIAESSHLKWEFPMPHPLKECPKAASVEAALKEGTLCALIYAPMINPLTQQVVGPDREVVRGMVHMSYWLDKVATVYLAARYDNIAPGDIISDLSIWNEDKRELLSLNTTHRWWTRLPEPMLGSDKITSIPTLEDRRKQRAYYQESVRKAASDQLEADRRAKAAEVGVVSEQRTPGMRVLPSISLVPNRDNPVKDFIIAHHNKAKNSDVEGLVEDYAERVDYFTQGLVDQKFIMQAELKHHTNHVIEEESIVGDIWVKKLLGNSGYKATYLLKNRTLDLRDNRRTESLHEINLLIIEAPAGLKIARQQATRQQ